MVQLDRVPGAKEGDEAVIIGRQGETHLSAEQVADRWGTINYEVTCGIGARVPRVYSP
jgi:alanine racemase